MLCIAFQIYTDDELSVDAALRYTFYKLFIIIIYASWNLLENLKSD